MKFLVPGRFSGKPWTRGPWLRLKRILWEAGRFVYIRYCFGKYPGHPFYPGAPPILVHFFEGIGMRGGTMVAMGPGVAGTTFGLEIEFIWGL